MTSDSTSSATFNADPLGPTLADACPGSQFVAFMTVLNVLIRANNKISGLCERVKSVERPDEKYDFVVVGGGAAGSVLAARLSEISNWKVLLLEAGPDEPAGTEIPGFATKFIETDISWNYTTTNESYACLSSNGSCVWRSGKNLGGNTAHNVMLYLRGNPTDYNNWADLGNEGWTWEEVEPFFIKGEDNGEIERVGTKHHGTGGPLSVERFPYVDNLGNLILDAAIEVGYGVSEDLNGDQRTGFSFVQSTTKKGVRRSSARAYLWPVRNRKNLDISLNSIVIRVIMDNDRAVGVEYYKNGERKIVYATREVILSAGAVQSPHILLLSGIGPKEHLDSFNIEVVKDVPGVGENLQDHTETPILFTINDIDTYDNDWAVAVQYLKDQTGPLSGFGSIPVVGMLTTNFTAPDYPDIELYFVSHSQNCALGRITLASKDPFALPMIWANYLSDREDVDRIIDGLRMVQALFKTEALSDYNFTLAISPVAACSDYEFQTDEYWACVIRQDNYPTHHQVGTCKMGPSSDPMAVVDPRLRVHGIKGLRVVDNSIMPQVTSCNTAAPAMMIGERGADFIKKDWAHKIACIPSTYHASE